MSQPSTTEAQPFTKADAVKLWNEAGGLFQTLDSWWGRGRQRRVLAAHGPVGGLALTLFDFDEQHPVHILYERHVRNSTTDGQPFEYDRPEEVTVPDAIGTAAIIATVTDREVSVTIDEGVRATVRPGESPQAAVARLVAEEIVVDSRQP